MAGTAADVTDKGTLTWPLSPPSMVKELRERTGAGMMDCKTALDDTNGDMEQAVDLLRKKGLAKAAKKASRIAAEGLIGLLVKGTKGVVVEVNSETDFVARNDLFQGLVMMIADARACRRHRRGDDQEGESRRQQHRRRRRLPKPSPRSARTCRCGARLRCRSSRA